jgi:SpoVK/Ycf46/Vps4 family AAA+-type ATPase
MEQLNLNNILNRTNQENKLIEYLNYFEENKKNLTVKRGIYIYGSPGSGKTMFVEKILKKLNYDILKYDAGDVRNKNVIDTIANNNMSDKNILSMFYKKIQKIVIVMDEIDGMNSGDKGGINTLIKLIRPKKTKKQKKENNTMIPIICIGNYHLDKKIKELMKVSNVIELPNPDDIQITFILKSLMPNIDPVLFINLLKYVNYDLRKINSIYKIYNNQQNILQNKLITNMFQSKTHNEDTKDIAKNLLTQKYKISDHNFIMNETDRTSVGLLFHENIIDPLELIDVGISIPFYIEILKNITFSDYIDRITFQKQIWIFNEMSSLIKTMYNNHLYNEKFNNELLFEKKQPRFTKVLTKYSTEYNNMLFIQSLCQQLNMDKKDMLSYFIHLRQKNSDEHIIKLFQNENYNIGKLDINRIYRFIDNYTLLN